MSYQRAAIILLTLFLAASVVLGTLAWRVDHQQSERLDAQQARSHRAICAAALVISREPHRLPAFDQGETLREFERRVAGYARFLAGARQLGCQLRSGSSAAQP